MPKQKAKIFELTQKQRAAWGLLEDPRFRRYLFDGGARSGKTDCTVAWLVSQASRFPGARILIARWRREHAKLTLWSGTLKKLLPPGCSGVRYHESEMEARFPNGSMIRIGAAQAASEASSIARSRPGSSLGMP